MKEKEEKQKSNRGIIVSGILVSVFVVLAVISVLNPLMLIGIIWDHDIEKQLLGANDQQYMYNQVAEIGSEGNWENEPVKFQLTYYNSDETQIRVQRAIDVFEKLFSDPDKTSEVIKIDDTTVWMPE